MKSLYYLAPKARLSRFDDLWDREDLLATAIDSAKIPSLVSYVMNERAISQIMAIVLDVDNLTQWSRSHVLSAVQQLKRFSKAQIIVIGTPCDEVSQLFKALSDIHHVDDLLMADPGSNIEQQLSDCFAPPAPPTPVPASPIAAAQRIMMHGAPSQQAHNPPAVSPALPRLNVPEGLCMTVATAGTMARCGTTTQAHMIAHYLNAVGFRTVICDRNGRVVKDLLRFTPGAAMQDGVLHVNDVDISDIVPDGDYNAIIMDFGVLSQENVAEFCEADVSVLVGCTKVWELAAFADAHKLLFPYSPHCLVMLASFSTQEGLDRIAKYLGTKIGLAPFSPDLGQLPQDCSVYTTLLLPELEAGCRQTATHGIQEETEAERC